MIISHFRRLGIRKSACVNIFGSVQMISRLDSQSKFQMFTLFLGRPREDQGGPPRWRLNNKRSIILHARNVSTNISTLGECTYLKLGEL